MALWVFRHETSRGCPGESPFHSVTAGNELLPLRRGCHEGGGGFGRSNYYSESFVSVLHSTRVPMLFCMHGQSCPTLCDPLDHSPPGSSVHGILWARRLEWAAISFFRGSSRSRDRTHISCLVRRTLSHWATWAAGVGAHDSNQTICYNKITSFTFSFLVIGPEGWCFKIRWNQMQAFNSKEGAASATIWGDGDASPLKINMVTCLY